MRAFHSVKYIFIFCLLLFTTSGIYALDGAFFGIGAEVIGNSIDGQAAGGNLSVGIDVNKLFSFGLKNSVSFNFDKLIVLENSLFFRFFPIKNQGLFLQPELGASILFENDKFHPVFSGGLCVGWRFIFGNNFYLYPAVRGGYPYLWGVGLTAGMRFGEKP